MFQVVVCVQTPQPETHAATTLHYL